MHINLKKNILLLPLALLLTSSHLLHAAMPSKEDMLIEAATVDGECKASAGSSLLTLELCARNRLEGMVTQYDDAPSDWSKSNWQNWWSKHRGAWKSIEGGTLLEYKNGMKAMQKMCVEIAKRLER